MPLRALQAKHKIFSLMTLWGSVGSVGVNNQCLLKSIWFDSGRNVHRWGDVLRFSLGLNIAGIVWHYQTAQWDWANSSRIIHRLTVINFPFTSTETCTVVTLWFKRPTLVFFVITASFLCHLHYMYLEYIVMFVSDATFPSLTYFMIVTSFRLFISVGTRRWISSSLIVGYLSI